MNSRHPRKYARRNSVVSFAVPFATAALGQIIEEPTVANILQAIASCQVASTRTAVAVDHGFGVEAVARFDR